MGILIGLEHMRRKFEGSFNILGRDWIMSQVVRKDHLTKINICRLVNNS